MTYVVSNTTLKLRTPSLLLCSGVLLFLPLALHSKISAKQYAIPLPLTDTPPNWVASENAGMTKAQTATTKSPYVRFNEAASNLSAAKLPEAVASALASAVLREASQRTGLPISQLRVEKFQRIEGSSSCLGLPPRFGEFCSADLVHLWQVTVAGGEQRLVYHTNLDGSKIKLNQTARISIP